MKKIIRGLCSAIALTTSFLCWGDEVVVALDHDDEGGLVASDIIDFIGQDQNEIFAKTVNATRDIATDEDDEIIKIDFANRKISFQKTISNGKGGGKILDKDIASYKFVVTMSPGSDGNMLYVVDDMWVSYKDKGIFQKTVPIASLKDDNAKHDALKKEFVNILQTFMATYIQNIRSADYQPVSHWSQLEEGRVIKGMSEYEVKLLKGTPRNTNKNGSKLKWIYSNSNVVVFNNGVVTSVID